MPPSPYPSKFLKYRLALLLSILVVIPLGYRVSRNTPPVYTVGMDSEAVECGIEPHSTAS